MSPGSLKAFIGKVAGDKTLQDKLKGAKTSQAVVDLAKEHGHEVSSEHINQLNLKLRKSDVSELNAEELEAISGGSGPTVCMQGCSWGP